MDPRPTPIYCNPLAGRLARALLRLVLMLAGMSVLPALAQTPGAAPVDPELQQQIRALALDGTQKVGAPRVEVQVGELDARLHLAACAQIEPYVPNGARLWGKTRIGIRCLSGPSRWNVFLPVVVKVYGPGLVATAALPAGSVLAAADIAQGEVDLAEDASNALTQTTLAVGRTLARPLKAGQGLRQASLQPRQWFAAGETVQVVAQGSGFSVGGEGQALTAGLEGQSARVRTEGGRILSGLPVGERRIEVAL